MLRFDKNNDDRGYIEHGGKSNTEASKAILKRLVEAFDADGIDIYKDVRDILSQEDYVTSLTEAAKITIDENNTDLCSYAISDIDTLNQCFENVGRELHEATTGMDNLSPILLNSFGIMQRSLMGCNLHKALKNVTATKPGFKLTERVPYLIDVANQKRKFVDAFAEGSDLVDSLKVVKEVDITGPVANEDLYGKISAAAAQAKTIKFDYDTAFHSFVFKEWTGGSAGTAIPPERVKRLSGSTYSPNVQDGQLTASFELEQADNTKLNFHFSAKFDMSNGVLSYVTVSEPAAFTSCKLKLVVSPETHENPLVVGYDTTQSDVVIPVGNHWEYSLSEEFKDAATKFYNTDSMSYLTSQIGTAIEQTRDMEVYKKYKELADSAVFKGVFDCEPPSGFSQGKEEWIKREFNPYMTQVAIILKAKVQISNCHFRVAGNTMDIRVPSAEGTRYIYKKNTTYAGGIQLDYNFAVSEDSHTIYYLSTDRMPQGLIYMYLIPNSIEDNILTVNFYEYATYVSNAYRSPKNKQLPTVMISSRYLAKEYFPVVATVEIQNNMPATK